jgi:hypothetical protein
MRGFHQRLDLNQRPLGYEHLYPDNLKELSRGVGTRTAVKGIKRPHYCGANAGSGRWRVLDDFQLMSPLQAP